MSIESDSKNEAENVLEKFRSVLGDKVSCSLEYPALKIVGINFYLSGIGHISFPEGIDGQSAKFEYGIISDTLVSYRQWLEDLINEGMQDAIVSVSMNLAINGECLITQKEIDLINEIFENIDLSCSVGDFILFKAEKNKSTVEVSIPIIVSGTSAKHLNSINKNVLVKKLKEVKLLAQTYKLDRLPYNMIIGWV